MTSLHELDVTAFPAGHRAWHDVALLSGPDEAHSPLLVVRGMSEGPSVLVSAGVHGDEYEGIAAISRFAQSLDPAALSGTFVALPNANPFACAAQSRESPESLDGLNLARQFPGDPGGSPTQRLAHALFTFATRLLGPADLFVDLHSGGTRYEFLPMVGFHPTEDATEIASLRVARAFGIDRIWRIPASPTSTFTFNGAVSRAGIPTIGTETRGRGGLVESDVAEFVAGLRNTLVTLGMLDAPAAVPSSDPPASTRTLTASTSGLFVPSVDLADRIESGHELARIVTPTGNTLETLVAPEPGEVWAIRRFASVRPDDIALMIALERE